MICEKNTVFTKRLERVKRVFPKKMLTHKKVFQGISAAPAIFFCKIEIEENTKQASGFSIIHNIFNFYQYEIDCQKYQKF